MYSLSEVISKAKRDNDIENRRLHPFAARVSIYFSWIFINLGLTPNQVTGIFFLTGLIGSFLIYYNTMAFVLLAYFCFRMHIVFDVCDGEVARFTKKYSLNGSYWDYMIHAVLYPLYFAAMCIAQYQKWDNVSFLFIAIGGSIAVGLTMAVKNNFYRALLFNRRSIDEIKGKTQALPKKGFKFNAFSIITEMLNFEGLFVAYIIAVLINQEVIFYYLLIFYVLMFLLLILSKFVLFSIKGFYPTRS